MITSAGAGMINLIVAVDQNNAIGWDDGRLAWRIPEDMRRFKSLTTGHSVVMGRKTFLSLGRPDGLPDRENYVLTRRPYSEIRHELGDVFVLSSLDWLTMTVQLNGEAVPRFHGQQCWIIGGAEVYNEALSRGIVDKIYLTQVLGSSGAPVKLQHDLFNWKLFVLQQRAIGINWEFEPISSPLTDPQIAFSVLHKV